MFCSWDEVQLPTNLADLVGGIFPAKVLVSPSKGTSSQLHARRDSRTRRVCRYEGAPSLASVCDAVAGYTCLTFPLGVVVNVGNHIVLEDAPTPHGCDLAKF